MMRLYWLVIEAVVAAIISIMLVTQVGLTDPLWIAATVSAISTIVTYFFPGGSRG